MRVAQERRPLGSVGSLSPGFGRTRFARSSAAAGNLRPEGGFRDAGMLGVRSTSGALETVGVTSPSVLERFDNESDCHDEGKAQERSTGLTPDDPDQGCAHQRQHQENGEVNPSGPPPVGPSFSRHGGIVTTARSLSQCLSPVRGAAGGACGPPTGCRASLNGPLWDTGSARPKGGHRDVYVSTL